jgi:hypothetical protein
MSTFIDLLRQRHSEFERQFGNQLSHDSRRAIYAMLSCKTGQQARSQWYCSHCQHDDRLPLSCGYRHCPQCQQRKLHPHLHIIVASGCYNKTRNQWHKGKRNYLFNAFALAKVWRARMLNAINHHADLSLPQTDKLPTQWVVDCRKVGYGLPALKYLSRYLYRGVLPEKDIIDTSNNNATFKYKDGQTQATKTRTLPTLQFLWLILQHVLPKGLQRVRDYGFLHRNAKRLRLRIQVILLHPAQSETYLPLLPARN